MSLLENHGTARRVPEFNGDGWSGFSVWFGHADWSERPDGEIEGKIKNGSVVCKAGDWIIRTIDGRLHIANPA